MEVYWNDGNFSFKKVKMFVINSFIYLILIVYLNIQVPLERDDNCKDDSIVNEINSSNLNSSSLSLCKLNLTMKVDQIRFHSLEDKLDDKLFPVFKLFNMNLSCKSFIYTIENYFQGNQDFLVDHMFKYLDEIYHKWYFTEIYLKKNDWSFFVDSFISKTYELEYNLIQLLSESPVVYLKSIEENYLDTIFKMPSFKDNPGYSYFSIKVKHLQMILKLDEKTARLYALGTSSLNTYYKLRDLISNDSGFSNYLKYNQIIDKNSVFYAVVPSFELENQADKECDKCLSLKNEIKELEIKLKDQNDLAESLFNLSK